MTAEPTVQAPADGLTEYIQTELEKFNVTDAAIAKMEQEFMPLSISGLEDKDGYKKVREARLVVKGKRVEVEKRRKELKEDSLKFGRAVDSEARRITALLEPIEQHLEVQQKAIDDEKERLAAEAQSKIQERLQYRVNVLSAYSTQYDVQEMMTMSDEDFAIKLEAAKEAFEKEEERKLEEKRLVEEERKRLAKVAEEQEEERKRLAKERAALEAGRVTPPASPKVTAVIMDEAKPELITPPAPVAVEVTKATEPQEGRITMLTLQELSDVLHMAGYEHHFEVIVKAAGAAKSINTEAVAQKTIANLRSKFLQNSPKP